MLTFQKKKIGGNADESQPKDQCSLIISDQSTLWLSDHRPTTVKDLALHSSRVKSIQDWILKATAAHKESFGTAGFRPHILALSGASGAGKSTAVELLCKELSIPIKVWTEDSWDHGSTTSNFNLKSSSSSSYSIRSDAEEKRDFLALNRTKVEELNDFAIRSAYPSIDFITKKIGSEKIFGRNDVEKSEDNRILKEGIGEEGKIGREEIEKEGKKVCERDWDGEKSKPTPVTRAASGIICIDCDEDDDIDVEVEDFEECAHNFHTITDRGSERGREGDDRRQRITIENQEKKREKRPEKKAFERKDKMSQSFRMEMGGREDRGSDSYRSQIVLMEDPPHLLQRMYNADKGVRYTDNQNDRNESAMATLLGTFRDPLILIISDVCGKDDAHFNSERCLPVEMKSSVELTSIYCQPITDRKTLKVLEKIVVKERLQRSKIPAGLLENIASTSMGDLRHSIVQLQLMIISNQYKQKEILKIDSQSSSNLNCESRLIILKNNTKNGMSENQSGAGRKSEKFSGALSDISNRSRGGDGKKKGRKRSKRDDDSDDEGEGEGGRGGEGEGECSGERREDREREGEREGGSESGYEKGHRHRIERRDVAFSSMHCVAKLSKAKLDIEGHLNFDPDSVISRTDLGLEMVYLFLQWNSIDNLIVTNSIALFGKNTTSLSTSFSILSKGEDLSSSNTSNRAEENLNHVATIDNCMESKTKSRSTVLPDETDVLNQIEAALNIFSDLDLFLSRKYDPSVQMDRSDTSIFPEAYVSSLSARALPVSRGRGAQERNTGGKERGAKTPFLPSKRPKILNLRSARTRAAVHLQALRNELAVTPFVDIPSTSSNDYGRRFRSRGVHVSCTPQGNMDSRSREQEYGADNNTNYDNDSTSYNNDNNSTRRLHRNDVGIGLPYRPSARLLSIQDVVCSIVPHLRMLDSAIQSEDVVYERWIRDRQAALKQHNRAHHINNNNNNNNNYNNNYYRDNSSNNFNHNSNYDNQSKNNFNDLQNPGHTINFSPPPYRTSPRPSPSVLNKLRSLLDTSSPSISAFSNSSLETSHNDDNETLFSDDICDFGD